MPCPARQPAKDSIRILVNPYDDDRHARAIFELLDHYARDPMGGGHQLLASVRHGLVPELRCRPWIVTLLAIDAEIPVGLLTAVEGFSTFAAKPLLNIHDLVVRSGYRSRGIGTLLLREAEVIALKRNCCKMTLEVLDGNEPAKRLYQHLGFHPYKLDPAMGSAQFWEKPVQH